MKLKTLELMKAIKLQQKAERNIESTKNRKALEIELTDTLDEWLTKNDKIMIEIQDVDLPDFVDILNEKLIEMYDFDQVARDKFIFYNKEMTM